MSIAERAKELATKYMGVNCMEHCWCQYSELLSKGSEYVSCEDKLVGLIEQALLAERRLAMEEAQKIATMRVKHQPYENCRECELVRDVIIDLRAAAEKEVGK